MNFYPITRLELASTSDSLRNIQYHKGAIKLFKELYYHTTPDTRHKIHQSLKTPHVPRDIEWLMKLRASRTVAT